MTSFFGCFFIMSLGIVIVVGSQSDWNWFWNERRLKRLVRENGKFIARIITACLGTFFIFISIISYSKTFNSNLKLDIKIQNQLNEWNI